MHNLLYHYVARVLSAYDGDSITVDIDLGFKQASLDQKLRLFGVDTWEINNAEQHDRGIAARDYVRGLLPEGCEILLHTMKTRKGIDKTGKYGRWLAIVHAPAYRITSGGVDDIVPLVRDAIADGGDFVNINLALFEHDGGVHVKTGSKYNDRDAIVEACR